MAVDTSQIDAEYQRGHKAHLAGDLEAAEAAYQQVLAQVAEHAPSLHGMGNICLRRGHIERAEALIRQALDLDALAVGFHTSLGNVLRARGLDAQARAAYEAELKVRPDFAIAHNQLGTLALEKKQPDTAAAHFQNAIKHAPKFAVAANNLGRALNNLQRFDEAIEAFRHALRIDEGFADAHANLAHVLRATGDAEAAKRHFDRALSIDPQHGRAHRGRAQLALMQGHIDAALTSLSEAVRVDPTDATAFSLLGATYFMEGMPGRASEAYDKALDLRPDDPTLLSDAAAVSRAIGKRDVARDRFKSALAIRSTHQESLAGLAMLMAEDGDTKAAAARLAPTVNSGRASPELLSSYAKILGHLGRRREGIALLESALQKRLEPAVATQLHFALAALLDGEGSYDLAFFHGRRANEARRTTFDPGAFKKYINEIIAGFSTSAERIPDSDWHAPSVVLIVGLPRSGVQVAERLLARHSKLEPLGASSLTENAVQALWRDGGQTWPAPVTGLTAQDSSRAAHQSMSGRVPTNCTRPMVLDTTWRNYFYLGPLTAMFPGLRVIECTRDARDIARSCYFRDFSTTRGLPFSYDLAHIAAYVNGYRRLMDHWRDWPGLAIHRLNYERLVLDPARECRLLSDFLGLEHDEVDFDVPRNPEPGQWHLDARALRRYRHYRSHLEAFTDALDAPPDA